MKLLAAVLFPGLLLAASSAHQPPSTMVVDASQFYHKIPLGDSISEGGGRGGAPGGWMFNNAVLVLGSTEEAVATVPVPETGDYNLYVRSRGTAASGFKVSIAGKAAAPTFGNEPLGLKTGGSFHLIKRLPAESR